MSIVVKVKLDEEYAIVVHKFIWTLQTLHISSDLYTYTSHKSQGFILAKEYYSRYIYRGVI